MREKKSSKLQKLSQTFLRSNLPHDGANLLTANLTGQVLAKRPLMRFLILALALAAAICGVLGAYCQKQFIDALLMPAAAQAGLSYLAIWIGLAFLALFSAQGLNALLRLLCIREGSFIHRWLASRLYTHVLRLDHGSRTTKTLGELVSLYAQDVNAAEALVTEFLPMFVSTVVPLIVAPLAIGLYFSVPLWPLAVVAFASLAMLIALSLRQSSFFKIYKNLAAKRIGLVNEWLQNIRIIRILGWTEAFERKLFQSRRQETQNRLGMVTNGAVMIAYAQVAPGVIAVTGIGSIVLSQVEVTAGEVFTLLWVLSVFLTRSLRAAPWNIVTFVDGRSSCKRLERVFALATEAFQKAPSPALTSAHGDAQRLPSEAAAGLALDVQGLCLSLGGKMLLKDVSFQVAAGEFVAIVGEVGAGKTLLLDSLIRETPAVFSRYTIFGRDALALDLDLFRHAFAYVQQDAFIMSSSLRDNVAFDYNADVIHDETINRSLKLAAFPASEAFASGDLGTEIGERGVNLSGGQRQRVNLGRAHFSERPIILLDDCLSAVDVETERLLLEQLVEGAWHKCTRLLVTHRLSVLPRVDRILVMSKGRIVAEGSFADLMKKSAIFQRIANGLKESSPVE